MGQSYEKNPVFTQYHGESSIYNLLSEEEALQGKDGISVYALALKLNGTVQGAKHVFDTSYKDNLSDINLTEDISTLSEATNKESGVFNVYFNSKNRVTLKEIKKINGYSEFIDTNLGSKSSIYSFNISF